MLTLNSKPSGASVYIDGVLVGKSPLEQISFSGSHSVTVVKKGYKPEERMLDVLLGQPNRLDIKLAKQASTYRSGTRPIWRLAVGGILAGGGLLTTALGISALSVHGACDETMPSVDGMPCPMLYFTNGVGGGLIGGGLAVAAAGVLLMAIPDKRTEQPVASFMPDSLTSALALSF